MSNWYREKDKDGDEDEEKDDMKQENEIKMWNNKT